MKKSIILFSSCLSAILYSCEKKSQEYSSSTAVDSSVESKNNCLLAYSEKLDQLLTDQLINEVVSESVANMEKNYSRIIKNPEHQSFKYTWKSDRVTQVNTGKMKFEVPEDNLIELNGLKPVSPNYFKASHRPLTLEEKENVKKVLENRSIKKNGNKELNASENRLKELGISRKTQKSISQGLGTEITKGAETYVNVADIGDMAFWNSFHKRLYVLSRGVEVSLSVRISADDKVNQEKALQIMRRLLDRCN